MSKHDARFWLFYTKTGKIILLIFALITIISIILEKVFGIVINL